MGSHYGIYPIYPNNSGFTKIYRIVNEDYSDELGSIPSYFDRLVGFIPLSADNHLMVTGGAPLPRDRV